MDQKIENCASFFSQEPVSIHVQYKGQFHATGVELQWG